MHELKRLWWIPVTGAVVAPLVTWFPMLSYRFPWIGLPRYPDAAQGIDLWSAQTFWFAGIALVAALIAREDRYLGAVVALVGLLIFFRGATMDPTHSVLFTLGALMVWVMRRAPQVAYPKIKKALVVVGTFELFYVLQQQFLGYDLLWGPLFGGQLLSKTDQCLKIAAAGDHSGLCDLKALGTIGTVDGAAAYISILAPLMPAALIPLVLLAVWHSHAVSGLLALAAGLAVRYRKRRAVMAAIVGACLLVAFSSSLAKSRNPIQQHVNGRAAIWAFAASDWIKTDPVVGYGLGGWAARIPALQVQQNFAPTKELWREAHNEYLQWMVELGLIGSILLAMWLYTHRAMFSHPMWGGSLAALGVNSIFFFPMHVVQISLVGLILVGLATAPTRTVADSDPYTPPQWGQES